MAVLPGATREPRFEQLVKPAYDDHATNLLLVESRNQKPARPRAAPQKDARKNHPAGKAPQTFPAGHGSLADRFGKASEKTAPHRRAHSPHALQYSPQQKI